MFNVFKKSKTNNQNESQVIYAMISGYLKPITQVADDVFSAKMMGDGFAIEPSDNVIYAPSDGEIISIFPTKHAITLKLSNGAEILIHIGIDTVELEGEPFTILVNAGDSVSRQTPLAEVNFEQIKQAQKVTDVLFIITNSDQYLLKPNEVNTGNVELGSQVLNLARK
ncbi:MULTISPECIES: PTS glucose transporter subunit IIA [unclassified Enterococcus]|uniref:PTS sugar transporter subunit IIA n=1 Tax=unclassified Enterococcus TaxID=2608891 RepID=UPI0015560AA3|nr:MULTISPECIES: PTS glucose transporter subunit IIA [unclassified Enterococcus]MBS7577824.1 PTS glucose transporter subunit IIA [Enterococcus sp. MMGLQ5-2]MBS7585084.1 PTS glucose transporter subunit IIA [Enterococcus sp. MMGLQ5-1]NPD12940.1 PTS glucose transporter subunit IIA [Enterococcus sp. MMGLQ5-1]NPD37654.1 PTS glucose transporter subunit IIA [Enterococcus sp. MMGLQ5-2]